jgi:hypothetical protein
LIDQEGDRPMPPINGRYLKKYFAWSAARKLPFFLLSFLFIFLWIFFLIWTSTSYNKRLSLKHTMLVIEVLVTLGLVWRWHMWHALKWSDTYTHYTRHMPKCMLSAGVVKITWATSVHWGPILFMFLAMFQAPRGTMPWGNP